MDDREETFMNPHTHHLVAQVLSLPLDDRELLLHRLVDSLVGRSDLDEAWDIEIARRIRELDSGEVTAIPLEAVLAEMRHPASRDLVANDPLGFVSSRCADFRGP
jgi:putative addiction module component (TIGR02574 family)